MFNAFLNVVHVNARTPVSSPAVIKGLFNFLPDLFLIIRVIRVKITVISPFVIAALGYVEDVATSSPPNALSGAHQ
ncbi:hypothetical protein HNR44_001906 [Geomicrobium halophilum]|uniref:Uncharacterized protein n=1 Tax=Geomicrobium halophilum TaxID=549000 RepID=A0A841Q1R1_9BACL|nr:hypothetical protein [Geomicrobium halophilum]